MSYHRVLLKLSGEALGAPATGHGIDPERVQNIAAQISRVVNLGVEVALVCGGGNILRGAEFSRPNSGVLPAIGAHAPHG